jgi:RHS repeat-associated protein
MDGQLRFATPSVDLNQEVIETGKAAVDEADSATGLRSLLFETGGNGELIMAKRLSLPSRVPFGVSEGNFVIGVAKTASPMRAISRSRLQEELGLGDRSDRSRKEEDQVSHRKSETANEEQVPGIAKARGASSGSSGKTMKMMSASPVGNFYIYSFDGKLLQLYNVYGTLLKDYVYMGDRLIAEYDHVGARFLYYTPDQINTTRVVTDGSGTVVYSAVHDPYGGIQQTGTNNTYDPQLKFSGKERDAESGLDYFGARYYDRSQYRFISPDPKLISQVAQADPQRWSLYPYCANNPVNMVDPSGRWTSVVHEDWTFKIAIMAGIPEGTAKSIARADKFVDNLLSGKSSFPASEKQRKDWHFISTERYIEALRICGTTLNAKKFGTYLHIIQDYFAHSAVALMGGSSHVDPLDLDKYAGIDDPYSSYHEWNKTMEMAQLTLDLMREFQQRVLEYVASVMTSIAPIISLI